MILLRANPELKKVFLSLIKTLGTNVVWNHIFVATTNTLILPGKVRSLFFNYDTKQIYTNLIDLEIDESKIVEIINDEMLVNTLNMTLYVFGKWGAINGLRVEKDYAQLNRLFSHILEDIKVEPSFRDDNFRFYKNKILISYEDVIQEILNYCNPEQSSESVLPTDEENKNKQENKEKDVEQPSGSRWKSPVDEDNNDDDEYKLGLWHNMKWITKPMPFVKTERTEKEANSRLGHSFYPVDYKCPSCGNKLYISLFPVNKEFPIETDEGKVYLARAYTCNTCNCFYTPRPDKLLEEGDIYSLEFDEDRTAYEDYLELLGNAGERCANYKFNEYEAQHNKNKEIPPPKTLDEICTDLDSIPAEELKKLEDKIFSGFYPETAAEKFYPSISKEKKRKNAIKEKKNLLQSSAKKSVGKEKKGKEDNSIKQETAKTSQKTASSSHKSKGIHSQDFSAKTADELKDILYKFSDQNDVSEETAEALNTVKKELAKKLREKYDAHMTVVERMSPKQLKDLKLRIESEQAMDTEEKNPYLEQINKILYHNQKKTLEEKAAACTGKSYHEINRVIDEIKGLKDTDVPPTVKKPILDTLYEQRKKSGEKEVEYLMSTLPPQLNKRQFEQFMDKLHKYEDVDISPYEKQLEQRRGLVEQQEINSFIARSNKKDRDSLYQLYKDLKEQGFSEKNVQPYLDKIHNKIFALDQEAIQKLLPSAIDMTFEEGLKAMEKIKNGVFLPEIKVDALEMLDKRLTKLKADESEQLARKLKKDMTPHIKDLSRFHFYEARKAIRGDMEEEEAAIFDKALNNYASERNPYEYPIMLSDTSRSSNGKDGFVLTPDHIFYKSLLHNGIVSVMDIDTVEEKNGLINKGVFAEKDTGDKVKLPISLSSKEWKGFAKVMNDFINYLQEKPESRSVSYLAKEKHEKKCCIRCGHVYTDGNVCPKCGSKNNK